MNGVPRLRLVVAAAGYGKTSALRHWYADPATRWHRATDLAAITGGGLREVADGASELVLDALPRMSQASAHAVLTAVAALPDKVRVALSSRWPLEPAPADWAAHLAGLGRAPVQTRPTDLALNIEQVAELLRTDYDQSTVEVAEQVRQATGGWPALVRLAAETLAVEGLPSGPLLPAMCEPSSALAAYVAEEVLGGLPAQIRQLLHDVAELGPVTAGLCAALGYPHAGPEIRTLARIGILTAAQPSGGLQVVPVVAAVAGFGHRPVSRTVIASAADFHRDNGSPLAAAQAYLRADVPPGCAQVLEQHGDSLIVTGQARAVAELVQALPVPLRTRRLRLLSGDALRTVGDVAAAAQAYQAVADAEALWDAGLAWRMGLVDYLRGDQPAALAKFDRCAEDTVNAGDLGDRAILLAWRAAATARSGDATTGVHHARGAYQLAVEAGQDSALATAHVSLALCLGLTGDQVGSEEHYHLALRIAERTGDLVLLARILTNQSYHLVEQARYAQAQQAAHRAAEYAQAAGHANLYALATSNEADSLAMLGRYDEALHRFDEVLDWYQRMGSRISAATLVGVGEVHRLRGWHEQAQATLHQALRLADEGDSRELSVKALAGLARIQSHTQPAVAAATADEAIRRATDDVRIPALLARGWVALAAGDRAMALELVETAIGEAHQSVGRRAGLAEALELRARAESDPSRARDALREAYAIWTEAGAVTCADRVLVALCRLPGSSAEERFSGLLAAQRLAAENMVLEGTSTDRSDVLLRTMGQFEVQIGGQPVPPTAWQSRRARDLLRILVARRGRPVPRSELCELLWPDDDPSRTSHRLSVLLSIVRGVLDPAKEFEPDHYLVTDAASVALDVTHLRVDTAEFLAGVAHGRRLFERGDYAQARIALAAAERDYVADVFADEPYADWADALREQARAAHVAALRMLAQAHRAARDPASAVECLLRLLEQDRYDEPAHRLLVRTLAAAGQHGEARRAFGRYRDAMIEIGVRPPDASILGSPQ